MSDVKSESIYTGYTTLFEETCHGSFALMPRCPLKSQSSCCSLSTHYADFYANEGIFLPDNTPAAEPHMAWKQIVGEESSRARRMRPPVQGLSQPYTWPTPTGTDRNSCKCKASIYLHFKQLKTITYVQNNRCNALVCVDVWTDNICAILERY